MNFPAMNDRAMGRRPGGLLAPQAGRCFSRPAIHAQYAHLYDFPYGKPSCVYLR
jgi:hypothetical protein